MYYKWSSLEIIEEAEEDAFHNYDSIRPPATIKGMSVAIESTEIELDPLDKVSLRR